MDGLPMTDTTRSDRQTFTPLDAVSRFRIGFQFALGVCFALLLVYVALAALRGALPIGLDDTISPPTSAPASSSSPTTRPDDSIWPFPVAA
jgi:hypothetical protein